MYLKVNYNFWSIMVENKKWITKNLLFLTHFKIVKACKGFIIKTFRFKYEYKILRVHAFTNKLIVKRTTFTENWKTLVLLTSLLVRACAYLKSCPHACAQI